METYLLEIWEKKYLFSENTPDWKFKNQYGNVHGEEFTAFVSTKLYQPSLTRPMTFLTENSKEVIFWNIF